MNANNTVQDGQVVSMEYTLKVDGDVLDTSAGSEPLEYIQGAGNIISGLEREMMGMAVGESKDVVVSPKDGYGKHDPKAFLEVPREEFPSEITLEKGVELQVHDPQGKPMHARIESVTDKTVRLDFNHPLAGKELHFSVKVVSLRAATDEELDHGHVHHADHHHHS